MMKRISRKTKHRILIFNRDFPNRCHCWILNNQTIDYEESGQDFPGNMQYYTEKCPDCGLMKYTGPYHAVIWFA